jgi:hypothetical protein
MRLSTPTFLRSPRATSDSYVSRNGAGAAEAAGVGAGAGGAGGAVAAGEAWGLAAAEVPALPAFGAHLCQLSNGISEMINKSEEKKTPKTP